MITYIAFVFCRLSTLYWRLFTLFYCLSYIFYNIMIDLWHRFISCAHFRKFVLAITCIIVLSFTYFLVLLHDRLFCFSVFHIAFFRIANIVFLFFCTLYKVCLIITCKAFSVFFVDFLWTICICLVCYSVVHTLSTACLAITCIIFLSFAHFLPHALQWFNLFFITFLQFV